MDLHAIESPSVLVGRGVPVVVYKTTSSVKEGQDRPSYEPVYDEVAGRFETEHKFVHLPSGVLAEVEEKYGTVERWQQALIIQPHSVVIFTLSRMWREPVEKIGACLLEGQIDEYVVALQVAGYRAQGVEVDDLGKLLKAGVQQAANGRLTVTQSIVRLSEASVALDPEMIDRAIGLLERLGAEDGGGSESEPTNTQEPSVSESENLPTAEPASKEESPAATRGRTGSRSGSKRAATTKSSGRSPRRSSTSASRR